MAGIWERVRPTGAFEHRLPILPFKTELTGLALGLRTLADLKTTLQSIYEGNIFSREEVDDIEALAVNIAEGTTAQRLIYSARLEWALMAAEFGQITEVEFRTALGI